MELHGSIAHIGTKIYLSGDVITRVTLEIPHSTEVTKDTVKGLQDLMQRALIISFEAK